MSGRVMAGVDGSETARKAVRWAAREARLRGMKLELVSASGDPISSYAHGYPLPAVSEEMKSVTERAEGHLAEARMKPGRKLAKSRKRPSRWKGNLPRRLWRSRKARIC